MIPFIEINEKIFKYYKKEHKSYIQKKLLLSQYYSYKILKKYHCIISPGADIEDIITFPHPLGIVIGDGVIIGKNVTIYQNVTLGRKNRNDPSYPRIGNNVIIYCNSVILGAVSIGDGAIIGANSVILRDVKKGERVCGIVK